MDNQLQFGSYNVPNYDESLSATYTAPGILPKEMVEKATFSEVYLEDEKNTEPSSFDKALKGIFSVPKPSKG
jgi:hypothetical protein